MDSHDLGKTTEGLEKALRKSLEIILKAYDQAGVVNNPYSSEDIKAIYEMVRTLSRCKYVYLSLLGFIERLYAACPPYFLEFCIEIAKKEHERLAEKVSKDWNEVFGFKSKDN